MSDRLLGKTSDYDRDMRILGEARGLLDIRVARNIHECRREAFDPLARQGFFSFVLLDGLQVRLRQPYLREAPANFSLERLATAFMNSAGPPRLRLIWLI